MVSPLVLTQAGRKPKSDIQVGDLVTVNLVDLRDTGRFVQSGARVERIAYGTFFVKLVGLTVPDGYQTGDRFPLDEDRVTDW